MAVDDLTVLAGQLPEVFARREPPPEWDNDLVFVPVDRPEAIVASSVETSTEGDRVGAEAETVAPTTRWDTLDVGLSGSFPGAPSTWKPGGPPPPPDAMAFYLPFHYFFPDWWGIYLTLEGVLSLARFISQHSHGLVRVDEASILARLFLYGHESYHHSVECFATRLEVTHRVPLYKVGFQSLYARHFGMDVAGEEALATAHGFKLAKRVAQKTFKNAPGKATAAVDALTAYILSCPPGYRRGIEVARTFKKTEHSFSEENHREALPQFRAVEPALWGMFPHAISGTARRASRVSYVVHRNSPLVARLPADLRYFRHGDLLRKLKSMANLQFVREGKGSHQIWRTPAGQNVVIPRHQKDIKRGTLKSILAQAGITMSLEEFVRA